MSVSIKTYLVGGSEETSSEIRRFCVESDVAPSFIYLQEKLAVIYPLLKLKQFIVQWKDDESDLITVSSDEELQFALSCIKDGILRLYIKIKTDNRNGSQESYKDEQHPMVTCDGCEKGVYGYRYKCVECPDYDLCSLCESRKIHSQHVMLRMPKPLDRKSAAGFMPWLFGRHHFGHRSFPFGRGFGRRHPRHCNDDKKWTDDSQEENENKQQNEHKQPNEGYGNYPLQFQKVMENIWTVLGGLPKEQAGGATASPQNQDGNSGENGQNQFNPDDFLKSVGQTVAAVLDPLGIDVEVDVDHNGTRSRCSFGNRAPSEKGSSPTKETVKTPEKEEAKVTTDSTLGEETKKDETAIAETPTAMKREDKNGDTATKPRSTSPTTICDGETGDWTYIGEKEKAQIPASVTPAKGEEDVRVSPPPTLASSGAIPKAAGGPPTSSLADEMKLMTQEVVQHSNPMIRDGLQQMLSMGFTNEGGWLTQLLEVKGGDIDSVLEVLAPVNKTKQPSY